MLCLPFSSCLLQLPSEVIAAANAGSVFECLAPPKDGVDGERAIRECISSGGAGDGKYDKKQKKNKGMFRMHTCWVKAGHDVLHEREPFLLLLLHKVQIDLISICCTRCLAHVCKCHNELKVLGYFRGKSSARLEPLFM